MGHRLGLICMLGFWIWVYFGEDDAWMGWVEGGMLAHSLYDSDVDVCNVQ